MKTIKVIVTTESTVIHPTIEFAKILFELGYCSEHYTQPIDIKSAGSLVGVLLSMEARLDPQVIAFVESGQLTVRKPGNDLAIVEVDTSRPWSVDTGCIKYPSLKVLDSELNLVSYQQERVYPTIQFKRTVSCYANKGYL